MKKLFPTIFLLLVTGLVYAQQTTWGDPYARNRASLRVGPEIGFATGGMAATQNFGTGVSALLSLPVSSRYSAVVSTGFMSFSGDVLSAGEGTKYRRANIFPLRGGLNYKLTPTFYTTTQLGYASARYLGQSQGGFSQGIGLGFFNGRFDVGAIWDHHYVHGGLGSINLKLGYAIFGRHNRF